MKNYNLKEILSKFGVNVEEEALPKCYGTGHINDTYIIDSKPRYILQRINTNVFKNPLGLMKNIKGVTSFLQEKIKENGGDIERETISFIDTIDGESFYKTVDGDCFRMYKFIDNARSYENVSNVKQFYNAAKAFGKFQKMLSNYPTNDLYEVIPDFHNTPKRINDLKLAISRNKANRLDMVKAEVDFAIAQSEEKYMAIVVELLSSNEIPTRVTHNDTKLNNVLLDDKTGEGICVIDLDTVMPGSLLYDFGDALRSGASTSNEDEKELGKINFDLELFKAFTEGFLEEVGDSITIKELELLPFSALLMTYECGIRFLEDYLNGDTYFKIEYPEHNLVRARSQFKLVKDIDNKMEQMNKIVEEAYKKATGKFIKI